jgi:hypothetical protein
MPQTFEALLAELIKRAASPDDPISAEFHGGDIAHLQRWFDSGEANAIWSKISKGPFNLGDAFALVLLVLELRRSAKKADSLNKSLVALARDARRAGAMARKRALMRLANTEITLEQHVMLARRIEQALQPSGFFDPLLSNRSDEEGSRRRTIFCRVLSTDLRNATERWHDAEVAVLCVIAFDCKGDVTVDAVKAARRGLKKR